MNAPNERPSRGPLVVLALAALLAAIVVPIVFDSDSRPPEPTPSPGIVAVAEEMRTVPPLPPALERTLAREIGDMVADLYERAFVTVRIETKPAPTGGASPQLRLAGLFTPKAAAALTNDADVFQRIEDLEVARGRVTFGGLATLEGSKPVQALLEIVFEASGTPAQRVSPIVRLTQRGTLLLVHSSNRWLVDGFDLKFDSAPVSPSPSPAS